MPLRLSSRRWRSVFEEAVEVAGEVALEAAVCFASCLVFLQALFDVGDRRRVRAFRNQLATHDEAGEGGPARAPPLPAHIPRKQRYAEAVAITGARVLVYTPEAEQLR
jgi:hypothetical protein